MVKAQPLEHQRLGKVREGSVAKVVSQRRQLKSAIARTGDAGQMVDAGGMVEPRREGMGKEQLSGHAGERDAGQTPKRWRGEESCRPGGKLDPSIQ
jgi:hypothetical protein